MRRVTSPRPRRERSRSRFHVAALLGLALLAAACTPQYGLGITELPMARGWQPLPIGTWVMNDGIEARAMSFCPQEACARPGFAALLALDGPDADALEKQLAADPASLARRFAQGTPSGKARKPSLPKSTTTVAPFAVESANGLLVEIRSLDETAKLAATAIVSGRQDGHLLVAIAVGADPDSARRDALSTWRSR